MIVTLKEIQSKTVQFFTSKGVGNAKLDTDLILAHALKLKRLDLYLNLERGIDEASLNTIRDLVRRRGNREPLQYILGETHFYDCHLKVDSRALIPRHETELLVEECANFIQPNSKVLDLGTGSGAIALAIANAFEDVQLTAVDKEATTLALAKENAESLGLETRICFMQSDWFTLIPSGSLFDLIISNPPYLTDEELKSAAPEVANYEPIQALVSKEEGLHDLKQILNQAKPYLAPNGMIALETGIEHHSVLTAHAQNLGFSKVTSKEDLNKRPRFLFIQV